MGTIGSGMWHTAKGFRNSPVGDRFSGAFQSVKFRAPVIGGNFAVWAGLFSTIDCALISVRQREDPWNAIASGAITGGLLTLRGGPAMATKNAIIGGVFLALIEAVAFGMNRLFAEQYRPPQA